MKPIFYIDAEDTFAVLHATYPVKHTYKCQFRNVPVRYFTQSSMGDSLNGDAVLLSRVADVFREVFDQPKLDVKPTTSPNDLAAWDSVAQVKLVMALEETF